MTIGGWIAFVLLAIVVGLCGWILYESTQSGFAIAATVLAIVLLLGGMLWYFNGTASGKRALVDQRSDFSNGMERTIKVYTADGNIIAEYTGKIDIEDNAGGYLLFDFEGKRYTYYNCFVESIAEIK